MKIVKEVHSNLEQQLEAYESLLNFAEQKNVLLSDSQDRTKAQKLGAMVKREVKVVQVLHELEKQRMQACDSEDFIEAIKNEDETEEILSPISLS